MQNHRKHINVLDPLQVFPTVGTMYYAPGMAISQAGSYSLFPMPSYGVDYFIPTSLPTTTAIPYDNQGGTSAGVAAERSNMCICCHLQVDRNGQWSIFQTRLDFPLLVRVRAYINTVNWVYNL